MASIIKANINLNEIPKDKIYKGKKGSYLPIKAPKVYLGNVKVIWTNGDNVAVAPRTDQSQQAVQATAQSFAPQDDDLPF
jgi:hypothetical protein